ncbi:hypothetical protein AK830_g6213 [Neonectria ditissima]|uniref:Uncharacterized protein n=1 Tax=Neonectria ditissima TaxID=78410 RepID=A0A0P7AR99_9HYPO|nr:hypothetical protein AK830_g6213 [Neonectria ditissima]
MSEQYPALPPQSPNDSIASLSNFDASRQGYTAGSDGNSERGQGTSAPRMNAVNPGQSDIGQATTARASRPPKKARDGNWDHTQYAPVWTDPEWEDDGPARQQSDWPIKDAAMSRIRPAMLARDQIQNPTEYAKRFGIFHGRSDGRSRTSPTRTESRKLFPSGNVRTGKDLFDRLEGLAAERGLRMDDFMADERIDMTKMNQADQQCMERYEDLLIDEFWQGQLFGDLTMDEMHAEDYFTMGNSTCDLQGPLYPLLDRSKWVDTCHNGDQSDNPKVLYNVGGERGEYDPRKNDKLWAALQPALQLASRLLQAEEPFLAALQDPSNRFYVDKRLDTRPPSEQMTLPRFKFRRTVDLDDPDLVPGAKAMRQIPNFDPRTFTYDAMNRVLELNIRGGHYHFDKEFESYAPGGVTLNCGLDSLYQPIKISLAAELVWPLLVADFSSSEKMIASMTIATTLTHEMMHAFEAASYRWLSNPAEFGIYDPHTQDICRQLRSELLPPGFTEEYPEPSFENDPVSEVGHAYEQHVLGGGTWTLFSHVYYRTGPPFIGEYAGVAVHTKWPDGRYDSEEILTKPKVRTEQYKHFIRIGDVQKYFTEAFWQNSVQRYGMAAMRDPSKKPHKVFFAPDEARHNDVVWPNLHPGLVEDRAWIEKYIVGLYNNGKSTLHTYLKILISEAFQFDFMVSRFHKNLKNWNERQGALEQKGRSTLMLLSELGGYVLLISGKSEGEMDAGFRAEYQTWENLALSINARPDAQSQRCYGDHEKFRSATRTPTKTEHCARIVRNLMDVLQFFEEEREYQESMMCEIYKLPSQYWPHYKNRLRAHYKFWNNHVDLILKMLWTIMDKANDVSDAMPEWNLEWKGRVQALLTAFSNIQRLLKLDNSQASEPNWRDLLKTVPMLRKSRHKSHERTFFLAKKEMLNLTGQELEDLREFKTRVSRVAGLESYKIVLPETDEDAQGLSQRWAGLLDGVLEKRVSGAQVAGIFNTQPVQNLVRSLEQEGKAAEAFKLDRAANSTATAAAETQTQQGPTLQQMAAFGAFQPPREPLQMTLPAIQGHAVPFGTTQWGHASTPSPRFPRHVSSSAEAFMPYSSNPTLFPQRGDGETSPWTSAGAPLAFQSNEPAEPPRGFGGILPHPYASRETMTKDLLNIQRETQEAVSVDAFAQQGPRKGASILGPRGQQGKGRLGNVDRRWEQQDSDEDMVDESQSESDAQDEQDILRQLEQDEREDGEREEAAGEDEDEGANEDAEADVSFSSGTAFMAKIRGYPTDNVSQAATASRQQTRERSDAPALQPDGLSGLVTGMNLGSDDQNPGVSESQTTQLKRKRSCGAEESVKKAKLKLDDGFWGKLHRFWV